MAVMMTSPPTNAAMSTAMINNIVSGSTSKQDITHVTTIVMARHWCIMRRRGLAVKALIMKSPVQNPAIMEMILVARAMPNLNGRWFKIVPVEYDITPF